MKRPTNLDREFWHAQARDNAGRAIDCVFEILIELVGLRGTQPPMNFSNARAFQRYVEMNMDEALRCAELAK